MWPGPLGGLAHARGRDDLAVELGRAAHVDQGQALVAEARQDVVAVGAQREVGLGQLVAGRGVVGRVDGQRQALVEPVLAPAVEDAHVAMAVQLELPVGPRREPVVVVAVQHDRRVRADARRLEQGAEVLARRRCRAGCRRPAGSSSPSRPRPGCGSARRPSCPRRPRRSARSGRPGGPAPRSRRRACRRSRSRCLPWVSFPPCLPGPRALRASSQRAVRGVSRLGSVAGRESIATAELREPLGTRGGLASAPG